jgi:hypothetical protein
MGAQARFQRVKNAICIEPKYRPAVLLVIKPPLRRPAVVTPQEQSNFGGAAQQIITHTTCTCRPLGSL